MEKKNNNGIVIILMGVIIVILAALCILFATNTIILNSKEVNDNNKESIVDNEKQEESVNQENLEIYDVVLKQYSDIIKSNLDDTFEYTNEYNYVFSETPYIGEIKKNDWYYTYYDINNDSNSELLIAHDYSKYDIPYFVDVIYSYKDNKIVKLDNYWSRSRLYAIYDNGKIVGNGSGGAMYSSYSFSTINSDLSLNKKECEVTYKNDNSGTIESITCNSIVSNINTIDELIDNNVNNGKKNSLEKLKWNKID